MISPWDGICECYRSVNLYRYGPGSWDMSGMDKFA